MFPFQNKGPSEERQMFNEQLQAGEKRDMLTASLEDDSAYREMQKERTDLVMWQQNVSEDHLDMMAHDLRREYKNDNNEWMPHMEPLVDEKTGEYVFKEVEDPNTHQVSRQILMVPSKPMCNDMCIQVLKAEIRPLLSRNLIMSNLTEDWILKILRRVSTLIINLSMKYEIYEIDFHDISAVIAIIKNYMEPAPFRAFNAGERKSITEITKRLEAHQTAEDKKQQKRGLFGMMER